MEIPFHFYPKENIALTLPIESNPQGVINVVIPITARDFVKIESIDSTLYGQDKLLLLKFNIIGPLTTKKYLKFIHLKISNIDKDIKLVQLDVPEIISNNSANQIIPKLVIDQNIPNAHFKYNKGEKELELVDIISSKSMKDQIEEEKLKEKRYDLLPLSDSCTIPPGS